MTYYKIEQNTVKILIAILQKGIFDIPYGHLKEIENSLLSLEVLAQDAE